MEKFLLSLILCSGIMSGISLVYIALSHLLKNVWSAKRRYSLWIFLLIGFLTPLKPGLGGHAVVITLSNREIQTIQTASAVRNLNFPLSIPLFLFGIWLLGVVIFGLVMVQRQVHFKQFAARFSRPCDKHTLEIVWEIAEEMGIAQADAVMLPTTVSPMMTGFSKPLIFFPDKVFSDIELRLIVRHELVHFKRRDLIYKVLMLICCAVHWFNPFIWIIVRFIGQECELACDETVTAGESESIKKQYCQSILSAATAKNQMKAATMPVMTTKFSSGKRSLKHRLKMIIFSKHRKNLTPVCAVILSITLFSGTFFSVEQFHTDDNFPVVETTYISFENAFDGRYTSTVGGDGIVETSAVVTVPIQKHT